MLCTHLQWTQNQWDFNISILYLKTHEVWENFLFDSLFLAALRLRVMLNCMLLFFNPIFKKMFAISAQFTNEFWFCTVWCNRRVPFKADRWRKWSQIYTKCVFVQSDNFSWHDLAWKICRLFRFFFLRQKWIVSLTFSFVSSKSKVPKCIFFFPTKFGKRLVIFCFNGTTRLKRDKSHEWYPHTSPAFCVWFIFYLLQQTHTSKSKDVFFPKICFTSTKWPNTNIFFIFSSFKTLSLDIFNFMSFRVRILAGVWIETLSLKGGSKLREIR